MNYLSLIPKSTGFFSHNVLFREEIWTKIPYLMPHFFFPSVLHQKNLWAPWSSQRRVKIQKYVCRVLLEQNSSSIFNFRQMAIWNCSSVWRLWDSWIKNVVTLSFSGGTEKVTSKTEYLQAPRSVPCLYSLNIGRTACNYVRNFIKGSCGPPLRTTQPSL